MKTRHLHARPLPSLPAGRASPRGDDLDGPDDWDADTLGTEVELDEWGNALANPEWAPPEWADTEWADTDLPASDTDELDWLEAERARRPRRCNTDDDGDEC